LNLSVIAWINTASITLKLTTKGIILTENIDLINKSNTFRITFSQKVGYINMIFFWCSCIWMLYCCLSMLDNVVTRQGLLFATMASEWGQGHIATTQWARSSQTLPILHPNKTPGNFLETGGAVCFLASNEI